MKKLQKVLLVGSSFSAAPMFAELKNRDFIVTVCGNYKNDPCHQYADKSLYLDYSVKEELLKAASSDEYSFIVPTCNDASYLSCAWVAQQLGFPGFDAYRTAQILHMKDLFRDYLGSHGYSIPKVVRYDQDASNCNDLVYPLLVKPTDSSTGKGCTKIERPSELSLAVEAAKKASASGTVVIEEFVQGALHSHSAFIHNGIIVSDYFVDEYCTIYPYAVNCSHHPSMLTHKIRAKMQIAISKLIADLKLCNGLLHTQFIVRDDKYWIIECMRRCPGDLYGRLIHLSTGAEYFDLYTRPFVGDNLSNLPKGETVKWMGRHTLSTADPFIFSGFSYDIPASNIEVVPIKCSGEYLEAAPYDKAGILFAEYSSEIDMRDITPKLAQLIKFHSLGASK